MENTKELKISIIILSWNTKNVLKQCLESLGKDKNLEIIVIDNHSTDGSPEMVAKDFPQIKLIKNKQNLGFAKGNNQGIKVANGDLVMLLNSDTIVEKKTIEKLVIFYQGQKDKNLAFSPLLLSFDGVIQEQYYLKPPNLYQIFFYHNPFCRFWAMRTPIKRLMISDLSLVKEKKPFEVEQLTGTALMAPKEVWQKVGLLDEDYYFLFEDVDWSYRARKVGVKLFVVPEARIKHYGGASWQKKGWQKRQSLISFDFYRQHFISFLLFVRKNYGKREERLFHWALLLNFFSRGKLKLFFYFLKK